MFVALLMLSAMVPSVQGTVVDANNHAVAGAKVGSAFQLAETWDKTAVQIGYGAPPVITDAEGHFSIPADQISYTKVLVASGPDQTMGFSVRKENEAPVIKLSKTATLDLSVKKGFGTQRDIGIDLLAGGSAVGYGWVKGSSKIAAPAGAFDLAVIDNESDSYQTKVELKEEQSKSLHVDLKPTIWMRNFGQQAPQLTPTDVVNGNLRKLPDLKGKWVLVDFWATWCQPCVYAMPQLIDFYEKHAELRDKFEIIAIHSPDGKNFAAIHDSYEQLVQRVWKGHKLPFPLIFDATGTTHKRWGVEAYPTSILINPEGKIVGAGSVEDLEKALARKN